MTAMANIGAALSRRMEVATDPSLTIRRSRDAWHIDYRDADVAVAVSSATIQSAALALAVELGLS